MRGDNDGSAEGVGRVSGRVRYGANELIWRNQYGNVKSLCACFWEVGGVAFGSAGITTGFANIAGVKGGLWLKSGDSTHQRNDSSKCNQQNSCASITMNHR